MNQITKVSKSAIKPGYIYVLTHPSDSNLYKIGVTILDPQKRLAQHNRDLSKAAGSVVRETGQKWEIKEYHAVPDPYFSESAFWGTTPYSDIPYRCGVEIERMRWEEVQKGLEAAKKAGRRSDQPLKPLPDWVYAYTAAMRKRLEGRDITLLGRVNSMISGKSDFLCANGHKWRTTPIRVAKGEGCPECGIGEQSPDEIREMVNAGTIYLLIHPDNPGLIKIGMEYASPDNFYQEISYGDWEIHMHRNIEENVIFAEKIMWNLLGHPLPHDRAPIEKDLGVAEEIFRKLFYVVRAVIAFEERRKESLQMIG